MNKMLINATQRDELRVAITQNGLLVDLDIEHAEQQQKQSNIYKGIITSIEPHLDAVFINYGSEKHGFLPVKEISEEYFVSQPEGDISEANIKKLLQEGQEVVVQVEKDERGTKGASLTTFISLAGSYLVLMPNRQKSGGISRRIDGEDREQLKQIMGNLAIPDGMSAIARTAGVGRSEEELQWDLQVLLR
ncbi:MAG: ribonuclease E, partial [Coxiellaceae bacterium]|nr:ribonuclease E [Coxiellaceae bacterium]